VQLPGTENTESDLVR